MKTVEEAIMRAKRLKCRIRTGISSDDSREEMIPFSDEDLERGIEAVRRMNQIDVNASAERLRQRLLKHRQRRVIRRMWTVFSGTAVAIIVILGFYFEFSMPAVEAEKTAMLLPVEIKTPTLLQEKSEDKVLYEPLQLTRENVYNVNREQAEDANAEITYEKVVIPSGYTYSVYLADGSKVILNAGSELRFPTQFADSVREVELEGEAFFEIVKAKVPFIVKSGDVRVQVYGTRFNFQHSEKSGISEVVLVDGLVGMQVGQGEELKITPNHRIFNTPDGALRVEEVNPSNYISWLGDCFKYEGVPLARIVEAMERWYGISIQLPSELGEQLYTLEFLKSSSVERAMQVLGIIVGKTVKEEGGIYYIEN